MMDMLCMPVESLMQKAVEYREVIVSFLLCPTLSHRQIHNKRCVFVYALSLRGSSPL